MITKKRVELSLNVLVLVAIAALLVPELASAQRVVSQSPVSGDAIAACARLLGYLEGGFGTLVAAAAGLGAIISSSVGGFKTAWSLLVVSIGCFILRSFLTLFLTGCGCPTC